MDNRLQRISGDRNRIRIVRLDDPELFLIATSFKDATGQTSVQATTAEDMEEVEIDIAQAQQGRAEKEGGKRQHPPRANTQTAEHSAVTKIGTPPESRMGGKKRRRTRAVNGRNRRYR